MEDGPDNSASSDDGLDARRSPRSFCAQSDEGATGSGSLHHDTTAAYDGSSFHPNFLS
jgi:hypothetical protein